VALSISFFSPNRTVLVVSDESLQVYAIGSKGARFVESIIWDVENFEDNVAAVLAKDCGGKPVVIINDMVEQHYRKEKIVKGSLGLGDKKNIVKRKLNMAFSNFPMRAAYALKEKPPKDGKKPTEIYIFAAIPDNIQFQKTLSAVQKSLVSVAGFCLLPVESADLVKALYEKIVKKNQPKSQWIALLGQHKNGGLRQLVIKNGDLALTRMTPVIDSDAEPEIWASEVRQEFNATLSYLSRFGFQPEDGLHVIAISGVSSGEALRGLMEETCSFTSLTATEAAGLLGMRLTSEDDRHAEILHAAWAGRKTNFTLPMKSQQLETVSKPRQIALAASVLFLAAAAYLVYEIALGIGSLASSSAQIHESNARLAQLNVQYQTEVERKEKLGFNVRLVQSSIIVYDSFEKNKIQVLPFFKNIGRALGPEMRVDKITITPPDDMGADISMITDPNAKPPLFESSMQMTYPSNVDVDLGNQEVKDLAQRLQKILNGYDVKVTKLLKDYEYSEELVLETGDLERRAVNQDYIAEISIKGPPIQ
jgi:hypothetical protein